jgi:hypothetical protein
MSAIVTSGVASFSTYRRQPGNRHRVALAGLTGAAGGAQRREGIVMNLAVRDDGDFLVEEARQRSKQPGLGLAAQSEEDEIVPGQDRVHHVRDNRLVVANDPGEQRRARAKARNQVLSQFVLDGSVRDASGGDSFAEPAESRW